eukprot:GFYU01003382.1.p1 GENE.GFYU01003382.1~~GFYU01003382.1.p1  ORF type:complete len:218 (-),score=15.07 GFYU01003382.1:221-874(-)
MRSWEQKWKNSPPATRGYLLLAIITTLACFLDYLKDDLIQYNYSAIVNGGEYWRAVSNLFFFGWGFDIIFNFYFLARYAFILEGEIFPGRKADFSYLLFLLWLTFNAIAPWLHVDFMGPSFTLMMVQLWGCYNPSESVLIVWLFNIPATKFASFLLLIQYVLLHNNPIVGLFGMAFGYLYHYTDVKTNARILAAPGFLHRLVDGKYTARAAIRLGRD